MNTYRYNPVFNRWVLLGATAPKALEITERHLLDIGKSSLFVAASTPRQPFIIDPPAKKQAPDDLLHQQQPPIGEAEVLLYTGERSFKEWNAKDWEAWLEILQQRIGQVYHNPYLHFVSFKFMTGALDTAGPAYLRAGDLVAASHAIAGESAPLEADVVAKLRAKESAFIVMKNDACDIYVPSAPLNEKEAWILPKRMQPSFERIGVEEQKGIAKALKGLFSALVDEWPSKKFTLTLHTALSGMSDDSAWWFQVHEQEVMTMSSYPAVALPEPFARRLEHSLLTAQR